ncbi:hypothetical protein C1Y63_03835 [Corynebacterium sp. 13CS0277]|uniref:copper chaperone PCu(A)C n=1 Tax=Corynebacterium sp. 13CS0277 TaxID=2071994 RepID=UPI000D042449|nr:copper chaperone PCu(A)C [Corynebacterium sp. 13CS0277]PRQ11987.1 hypothetical protein C1Y63_03835 [Corynebacterium sp. 13CS0277]
MLTFVKTGKHTGRRVAVAVSVAALALAGCSNSETDSEKKVETATGVEAPAPATSSVKSTTATAGAVTLTDGYVKAKPAEKSMTAIFGVLSNDTDTDRTITGFSTSLGQASYEIHEVVDGQMREKTSGVELPAGGSVTLAPGGDHFMIMGYDAPIEAGDAITVTLMFADGTQEAVGSVPVRTIAAGQENYGAGGLEANNGMSEAPAPAHQHG